MMTETLGAPLSGATRAAAATDMPDRYPLPVRAALVRPPRAFWLLLALALAVRLGAVAATPHYVAVHDDADYDRIACAVAEHGFIPRLPAPEVGASNCAPRRSRGTQPTAYRPPLWPLVLGATYALARPLHVDRWTAGRLVQAMIGTALVALTGLVAAELCGWAVGLVATLLAAIFLPLVLTGLSLISEPLFVALS